MSTRKEIVAKIEKLAEIEKKKKKLDKEYEQVEHALLNYVRDFKGKFVAIIESSEHLKIKDRVVCVCSDLEIAETLIKGNEKVYDSVGSFYWNYEIDLISSYEITRKQILNMNKLPPNFGERFTVHR